MVNLGIDSAKIVQFHGSQMFAYGFWERKAGGVKATENNFQPLGAIDFFKTEEKTPLETIGKAGGKVGQSGRMGKRSKKTRFIVGVKGIKELEQGVLYFGLKRNAVNIVDEKSFSFGKSLNEESEFTGKERGLSLIGKRLTGENSDTVRGQRAA